MNAVKSYSIISPSGSVLGSGKFPKSRLQRFIINHTFRHLKKEKLVESVSATQNMVSVKLAREPETGIEKGKEVRFLEVPVNYAKYLPLLVIPGFVGMAIANLALYLGASHALADMIFFSTMFAPPLIYLVNGIGVSISANKLANKPST